MMALIKQPLMGKQGAKKTHQQHSREETTITTAGVELAADARGLRGVWGGGWGGGLRPTAH